MKILKGIGNAVLKAANGYAKFVGKHPCIGYIVTSMSMIPMFFLACNGAYDLAGEGIGCEDAHKKAYTDGYVNGVNTYKAFVESQCEDSSEPTEEKEEN